MKTQMWFVMCKSGDNWEMVGSYTSGIRSRSHYAEIRANALGGVQKILLSWCVFSGLGVEAAQTVFLTYDGIGAPLPTSVIPVDDMHEFWTPIYESVVDYMRRD